MGGTPSTSFELDELVRHIEQCPGALQIKVIDGAVLDDRVGQGIVVYAGWAALHADLGIVNLLWRCGVDSPVEA
jgi:hypothetical protein